jgi:hypothetical protein
MTRVRVNIEPVLLNTMQPLQVECPAEQSRMALGGATGRGLPKPVPELMHELKHGEFA